MRGFWVDLEKKKTNLPVLKLKQVSRAHGEMHCLSQRDDGSCLSGSPITGRFGLSAEVRGPSPEDSALVSVFVSLVSGVRETHLRSPRGRRKGNMNLRKVRVAGQEFAD